MRRSWFIKNPDASRKFIFLVRLHFQTGEKERRNIFENIFHSPWLNEREYKINKVNSWQSTGHSLQRFCTWENKRANEETTSSIFSLILHGGSSLLSIKFEIDPIAKCKGRSYSVERFNPYKLFSFLNSFSTYPLRVYPVYENDTKLDYFVDSSSSLLYLRDRRCSCTLQWRNVN